MILREETRFSVTLATPQTIPKLSVFKKQYFIAGDSLGRGCVKAQLIQLSGLAVGIGGLSSSRGLDQLS